MKNEAEFNTLVKNSIDTIRGFSYKIPDTFTSTGFRGKAPFDGFGCYDNKMVVWESKYLQEPKVFPMTRLEDHQIYSLLKIYETFSDKDRILSLFLIGVNFGRNDLRIYVWKNDDLYGISKRKTEGKNIFKKEFEERKNYIKVIRGKFSMNELISLPKDTYEI